MGTKLNEKSPSPSIEPSNAKLNGLRIAFLATDGVEEDELVKPRQALLDAGAEVYVVSPMEDEIQMWRHHEPSERMEVDLSLDSTQSFQFDALVLPGGVMNPDDLRMNRKAVDFVRTFIDRGLPVAAICHAPWLLIEADAVQGVHLTSWPSLKTDLMNAGAEWQDSAVVCDGNFITSRKPDDIPKFNQALIELLQSPKKATSKTSQKRSSEKAERNSGAEIGFNADSAGDADFNLAATKTPKTLERTPTPGAEAAP